MGNPKNGMIGLWGESSPNAPIPLGKSHFALRCSLEEILSVPSKLNKLGITALDFDKNPTKEPDVLAWMPAASVYFTDPDDHSLEFISMLSTDPQPELGVLKYSDWNKR